MVRSPRKQPAARNGELQDAPTETELPTSDANRRKTLPAPSAKMGAEQSKEQINQKLRIAAADATRSTGKLNKPSRKSANPPYHNRVLATAPTQRRLGPTNRKDKDPFELENSPEKILQPPLPQQQADFSPTRTQRKRKQNDETSSPRRSRRQQGAPTELVESNKQIAVTEKVGEKRKRGRPAKKNARPSKQTAEESLGLERSEPRKKPKARQSEPTQDLRNHQSSTRSQQKIEELRRRRTEGDAVDKNVVVEPEQQVEGAEKDTQQANRSDAGSDYAPEDSEAEDNQDAVDADDDGDLAKARPVGIALDYARPSEMNFPEGRPESELDDDQGTEDSDDESPKKRRKKNASKKTAKANTGAKRKKTKDAEDAEDAEDDDHISEGCEAGDQGRLYGQWRTLQKVYKDVKTVGCNVIKGEVQSQNDIALDDEDVRHTMKLCKKAEKNFIEVERQPDRTEPAASTIRVLDEIGKRVDGLRGTEKAYPTDFKDQIKSTDIYFHLIPRLVKLVRSMIICYEAHDVGESLAKQISVPHLRLVAKLIQLILDLERTLEKQYKSPESNLHVVKPVHNGIAVPLRDVNKVFDRHIHNFDLVELARKERQQAAKDEEIRLEQAARQRVQQARINRLRAKWEKLHNERLWAEGGLIRAQKREHLQIPQNCIETDQNGRLFERTEVFHPRIGPPPGLVDRASKVQWTLVELASLCDGLKEYRGPNVYERIFRRYCGRGRELNRFNVTMIVTTAAGMKESLTNNQMNTYGDVEQWILDVPVWTKGHQALGKENEQAEEDAGLGAQS